MKFSELAAQLEDAKARLEVLEAENEDLRDSVYPLRSEVHDLKAELMSTQREADKVAGLEATVSNLQEHLVTQSAAAEELESRADVATRERDEAVARLESQRRARWLDLRDRTLSALTATSEVPLDIAYLKAIRVATLAYGQLELEPRTESRFEAEMHPLSAE